VGNGIHERTLLRAAGILGGVDALAERLQVHPAVLVMWMRGSATLPQEVFLKVVDIVLERDINAIISPTEAAPPKAPKGTDDSS
jgi:DNA-binding transcriptional regulator YdaS (Cro superfamily)